MLHRRVGLTSAFAAGRRAGAVIAVTVMLGAACGLSSWVADATAATPYLDSVAASLRASSPGTEGKIWWVSKDSSLPPGWLLQTPNCWGQLQCSQPPPGGNAILQRMAYLISTARESVDFAELYQLSLTDGGPEGDFLGAIIRGLRQGHESHPNQEPVVRVLIGKFPAGSTPPMRLPTLWSEA